MKMKKMGKMASNPYGGHGSKPKKRGSRGLGSKMKAAERKVSRGGGKFQYAR